MVDKVTCILHNIQFKNVCPECEALKQIVSIHTTSDNPIHESDYIQDLNYHVEKLKELNIKLNKLLGVKKPKETE